MEHLKKLLERSTPKDYRTEVTEHLAKPTADTNVIDLSVVIFRLSQELLALPTAALSEISEMRPIHRIPHRPQNSLIGLVNVSGQLKLCVSLRQFLEIGSKDISLPKTTSRMIVTQYQDDVWVCPVDEVYGIYRFDKNSLSNVPVTVVKSTANYLRGILSWESRNVCCLDEELLFQSLRRSIL